MNEEKLHFLQNTFPQLLKKLQPGQKPGWGVMNPQQMIEHMSEAVRIASGKLAQPLMTPAEQLPAYRSFVLSEKEFKPNTKNALMPEVPVPVKHPGMGEAIAELEGELKDFVAHYQNNPGSSMVNPFFGDLNFGEQVHLLHKHAVHHCKQFGLL